MRSFISTTLAVILMAIFTLFSIPENNFAKTGIMVYGGKSFSPNGALANQTFDGAAFGGEVRLNMHKRVSFGLGYMGQKATGPGERWDNVIDGQSIIVSANYFGVDISDFHVNPNDEYAALTITEKTQSKVVMGAFYISLLPGNGGSRRIVEPVIGIAGGINVFQRRTKSVAFYHPDLRAIEDLYSAVGFEVEHFKFDSFWDDGSGGAQQNVTKYEFIYGPVFGLNFYLPGNLVICPEARYLKDYGFFARIGGGFTFF